MKVLTIVHSQDKYGPFQYVSDGPYQLGIVDYSYACGWSRPHYPVPAKQDAAMLLLLHRFTGMPGGKHRRE